MAAIEEEEEMLSSLTFASGGLTARQKVVWALVKGLRRHGIGKWESCELLAVVLPQFAPEYFTWGSFPDKELSCNAQKIFSDLTEAEKKYRLLRPQILSRMKTIKKKTS
ncbi:hypothetical protein ACFLQ0_02390 [Nitrospinota bacterium]